MSNKTFSEELLDLINKHSMENHSDTPDFILRDYLMACLQAFDVAIRVRETWYNKIAESTISKG
jgi:hypothetical protein